MLSNHRRPRTSEIPGVTSALPAFWGLEEFKGCWEIEDWKETSLTQCKHCFTSVFCEAVISLRSSRPIRNSKKILHNCGMLNNKSYTV